MGVLRVISGAERIITYEHALEEIVPASSPSTSSAKQGTTVIEFADARASVTADGADWARTCFYITAIGSPGSPERQHSDLYLNYLVEPALEEFNMLVIRADQIEQAGMITAQILERIVRSKLVVADLSFHNPNVFYELALRHACRLPTVQIIRSADRIPFDLKDFRTILIDDATVYSLIPKLETHRAEIANQVRRSLEDADCATDNPVSTYFPTLRLTTRTLDQVA